MDRNQTVVPGNHTAAFVSDALAMEKNVYSLREIAKGLKRQANDIKIAASSKYEKMEYRLRCEGGASENEKLLKAQLAQKQENLAKLNDMKADIDYEIRMQSRASVYIALFVYFLLWIGGLFIVLAPVALLFPGVFDSDIFMGLVILVAAPLLIVPEVFVYSFFDSRIKKKAKKKVAKQRKPKIEAVEAEIEQIKVRLNSPEITSKRVTEETMQYVRQQCDKERQKAADLEKQARDCEEKAAEIRTILTDCYEQSNIIPPDYRYIDCVAVLHHAFRNGLADNMREAVLYYEQREFRQTVIRGVDNVYEMLGTLSNTMNEIKGVLNDIDNNVYNVMRNQEANISIQNARLYAEQEYHQAQTAHNKWVKDRVQTWEYLHNT